MPARYTPLTAPRLLPYLVAVREKWNREFDEMTATSAQIVAIALVLSLRTTAAPATAATAAQRSPGTARVSSTPEPSAAGTGKPAPAAAPARSTAGTSKSASSAIASTKSSSNNAVPRAAASTARENPGVGTMRRLIYEPAPYHGRVGNAVKSKAPQNGQDALDNSLQVTENSSRRIGIDPTTKEFVIFDRTSQGRFHGHVRTWDELRPVDRAFLRKEFDVSKHGKVPDVF